MSDETNNHDNLDNVTKITSKNGGVKHNYSAVRAEILDLILENDIYVYGGKELWWAIHTNGSLKWLGTTSMAAKFGGIFCKETQPLWFEIIRTQARFVLEADYFWEGETVPPETMNMLKYEFCKPVVADDYHVAFKVLFKSISGNKQENLENIEQVLLSKWQHPNNYVLPALVFTGDGGGTGKGVFVTDFLTTVFGKNMVADNVLMKDFLGEFNRYVLGKAVAFLNESAHERSDKSELKSSLGSERIRSNEKYQPKLSVKNVALYVIASNDIAGAVKLDGNGTDRRFSIITPRETLLENIQMHLGFGTPVTIAEEWLEEVMLQVLHDPVEVGKWLHCMTVKHGDVKRVRALHGEDYKKLLQLQDSGLKDVTRAVFSDKKFTYIALSDLYDLYVQYEKRFNNNTKVYKRKTCMAAVQQLIDKEFPHIERPADPFTVYNTLVNQNTTVRGFRNTKCHGIRVNLERSKYVERDVDGQVMRITFDFNQ